MSLHTREGEGGAFWLKYSAEFQEDEQAEQGVQGE